MISFVTIIYNLRVPLGYFLGDYPVHNPFSTVSMLPRNKVITLFSASPTHEFIKLYKNVQYLLRYYPVAISMD